MQISERNRVAQTIVRTIPSIMRTVTNELRQQNVQLVPAQLGVLSILAAQSCNLSLLAEYQGVSLPTMSSTVSKMVAQGWVHRQRNEKDRRMILLEITPEGQALLADLAEKLITYLTEALTPLTDDEIQIASDGLDVLQKIFPPFELMHSNETK